MTKKEHKNTLKILDALMPILDTIDRDHSIRQYARELISKIEQYEEERVEKIKVDPAEVLKLLMRGHNLKQKDLEKELGGKSMVSNILNGHTELSLDQINKLSKRFGVTPKFFGV